MSKKEYNKKTYKTNKGRIRKKTNLNLIYLQNEETASKCSIEEFAVFYLNFIRNQTEE